MSHEGVSSKMCLLTLHLTNVGEDENVDNCISKTSPVASPNCYSCSICPNLLNAKHRVVSVLMLGDVLQRFAFSECYECVQRQKESEIRQVVVKQKGSQYFD